MGHPVFSNNIPYQHLQSIFPCSSYPGIDLLIPGFEYLENGAGKAAVGFSVDMTTTDLLFSITSTLILSFDVTQTMTKHGECSQYTLYVVSVWCAASRGSSHWNLS